MFASTAAQVVDQSKGRSRRGGGFSVAGRRAWRAGARSAAAVLVGVAALPAAASAQVSLFGPTSYELGAGTAPTSVAVDDFNGVYGDVDLAVANQGTDNVSLLLGNGNGGFDKPPFGTPRTVAVGDAPSAVAAGEFNHNAKRDLAVVNGGSNNVSVLLGNGNAGFSLASTVGVGNAPSSVAVGYFNQDGHPDLAVANGGDGTVSVLAGDENGGFSLASTANVGSNPSSVAVGDFDGRNGPDLAVANRGSTYVSVLLNQGNGSFNQGSNVTLSDYNPTSVAVGDFDGRNGPDLAIAKTGFWGQVSVALGNGNGSFGSATLYWQGEYQVVPNSVAVADFNGDDKPDVGFDDGSSNVRVLLNNFGGSGGVNFYKAASRTVAGGPNSLAVGDFGSDSDADLAVANQGSHNVSVLLNNRAPIANADAYSTGQSTPLDVGAPGVLGNDTDPYRDGLTVALASGPAHAADFTLNPDGSFQYKPSDGYSGSDSFSYTVSDGHDGWNAGTVTLTVKPVA